MNGRRPSNYYRTIRPKIKGLVRNLRGDKMSKLLITSLILVFSLATSITQAASLFEERVAVIDNVGQDEIFGGSKQSELIITFTPRLTHDAGEAMVKMGTTQ